MSLEFYEHSIILPFSNINVDFRELNVKEEYLLSKINKNSSSKSFEYLLFKIIKNCISDSKILNNINILDYIILNLSLRIKSLGEEINLSSTLNEEETEKLKINKINFKLNLINFLNNLKKIVFENSSITFKNISLKLDWPLARSYFLFLEESLSELSKILEFVKEIIVDDKIINFNSLDYKQKLKIWERMPVNFFFKIKSSVESNFNNLVKTNLSEIKRLEGLNLNFFNENVTLFSKLLYQNSLENLLNEYFILSKNGISLDFIFKSDISFKNNLLEHIQSLDKENSSKVHIQKEILTGLEGVDLDAFIVNTQNNY